MSRPYIEVATGVAPYSDGSGYEVDITVKWDSETDETTITIDKSAFINARNWTAVKAEIDRALEYVGGRNV